MPLTNNTTEQPNNEVEMTCTTTSTDDSAPGNISFDDETVARSAPQTEEDMAQIKVSLQKRVYRVIVKEMEYVRDQREKNPGVVIKEPVALIKTLVLPEQAEEIQRGKEFDKLANIVTYQVFNPTFQYWICLALSEKLSEELGKPIAAQTLADINAAYTTALKDAKNGCLENILLSLHEGHGAFNFEDKVHMVPLEDINKARKSLLENPDAFDLTAYSPLLALYLNTFVYPKINEEARAFEMVFNNIGEAEDMLKECTARADAANAATLDYRERINNYAMIAMDILQEHQLEKKERQRGLYEFLMYNLGVPHELFYHPTLGYKLKPSEVKALLFENPLPTNYQDGYLNTLLHHAFANQNFEVAYALLQKGAKPDLKNHDGKVASAYTADPMRIEELTKIFQTVGQRADSEVAKKLAEILEKQKKRNAKLAKWSAVHSQKLLTERKKETSTLEGIVTQTAMLYHEDEVLKQVSALHKSINTSWRGNSMLKTRLGEFLRTARKGRIKSVRAEEFGRPIVLAIAPDTSTMCTVVADTTRERELAQENTRLSQTLATRDNELAIRTSELTTCRAELASAHTTITSLHEEKDEVERKYHQAIMEATTQAETAATANHHYAEALNKCTVVTRENQALRSENGTLRQERDVHQRTSEETQSNYDALSGRMDQLAQQLIMLMALQNNGTQPANDRSIDAQTDRQGNTSRFFGAQ